MTPWTVAQQAPLSMEFSREEHWSRLPFPTPGDLLNPGMEPASLVLAGGFFTTSAIWEAALLGSLRWGLGRWEGGKYLFECEREPGPV